MVALGIEGLAEVELVGLNRGIVERLHLLKQVRAHMQVLESRRPADGVDLHRRRHLS